MGEQVFLVDTSVFLEVLLEQRRAQECLLLFERLTAGGHQVALTTFSLYSIGLKLEKREMQESFRRFLADGRQFNFLLVGTEFQDEEAIFSICATQRLSFDDAHQYWAAKKLNAKLVSFDADFDRTDLKRYEPADILKELS